MKLRLRDEREKGRVPGRPSRAAEGAACVLLLAILGGCALPGPLPGPVGEGKVRVRLMAGEEALVGATVTASRDLGVKFQEKMHVVGAGSDGFASLSLPQGSYTLTARSDDGEWYGYYGPNPVQVRAGEEMEVAIRGVKGNAPPRVLSSPDGMSGVEGGVLTDEGPLAGATVAFYLDSTRHFRGPAYLEVETDGQGRFETSLSPGRYFLVVRRRAGTGGQYGPLRVGDHFGYYGGNPLYLGPGEHVRLQAGAVRVFRRSGWSGPSTLRTRLAGVVRDRLGKPLAGYRVFLHGRAEMLSKPEFVSEPSGPDGVFELWAEREGTFYVGARQAIGSAREEGEPVGYYEGTPDHSIIVKMDGREVTGLDVVVGGGDDR